MRNLVIPDNKVQKKCYAIIPVNTLLHEEISPCLFIYRITILGNCWKEPMVADS